MRRRAPGDEAAVRKDLAERSNGGAHRTFDLHHLWVGWAWIKNELEGMKTPGLSKGLRYFCTIEEARAYYVAGARESEKAIAITRADATSFVDGEGLEDA